MEGLWGDCGGWALFVGLWDWGGIFPTPVPPPRTLTLHPLCPITTLPHPPLHLTLNLLLHLFHPPTHPHAPRYLKRCGRDVLVQRLREAIAEEERLAALGAHRPGHGPPGVPGAGAGQGGMVDTGGRPVLPVDIVLKAYSRSIISAVGAEVDRIEAEIQVGAECMCCVG